MLLHAMTYYCTECQEIKVFFNSHKGIEINMEIHHILKASFTPITKNKKITLLAHTARKNSRVLFPESSYLLLRIVHNVNIFHEDCDLL